jgi:RNA polymerase primary sigma factor
MRRESRESLFKNRGMTAMTNRGLLPGPTKRAVERHRAGLGRLAPLEELADGQADHLGHFEIAVESSRSRGGSRSRPGRRDDEARARRLRALKLDYVYDPRFDRPDAEARFLVPMPARSDAAPVSPRPFKRRSLSVTNLDINTALLRPEEETYLFLKMNYLKYRASKLREALDSTHARVSEVAEIERLWEEALAVQSRIVRSNLRLVLSIAKKRARPDRDFDELVSEGNLSLMLAVAKFDASSGFKFSTYASCAIVRNLARSTYLEIRWRRRFGTGHHEMFSTAADRNTDDDGVSNGPDAKEREVRRLLSQLNDREREIVVGRFGLEGHREKTLRQLGEELGITKERVRQIESRAREKLRNLALEEELNPPRRDTPRRREPRIETSVWVKPIPSTNVS